MKQILVLLFLIPIFSIGQFNVPERVPNSFVHDYDHILTEQQIQSLNAKLREFRDSTTVQTAIVILSDLQGYEVEQVALEIGRKWGVGAKETNNGIVYLISPKNRKGRFEVGTGLEGDLPDVVTKELQVNARSYYKNNDYYKGLDVIVDGIIAKIGLIGIEQKKLIKAEEKKQSEANWQSIKEFLWSVFIIISIFVLILLFIRTRRNMKRKKEIEDKEKMQELMRLERQKLREQEEEKRKKEKYDSDVADATKYIQNFVNNTTNNAEDFEKSYDTVCDKLRKYSSIKYDKTNFNNYKKNLLEYASYDINMVEDKPLEWLLSVKKDMVKTYQVFTDEFFSLRNIYDNYLQQESYVANVKSTLKEYYEKAKAELKYTPFEDLMSNEYNLLMYYDTDLWKYYNLAKTLSSNYSKIIAYRTEQAALKAAEERAEAARNAAAKAREDSLRRSSHSGYGSSPSYGSSSSYDSSSSYSSSSSSDSSSSSSSSYDGGSFSGGGSSDNW